MSMLVSTTAQAIFNRGFFNSTCWHASSSTKFPCSTNRLIASTDHRKSCSYRLVNLLNSSYIIEHTRHKFQLGHPHETNMNMASSTMPLASIPTSSMSSTTMDSTMMMMSSMMMTFYTSTTTSLYSMAWTPSSRGQYAGTCIGW